MKKLTNKMKNLLRDMGCSDFIIDKISYKDATLIIEGNLSIDDYYFKKMYEIIQKDYTNYIIKTGQKLDNSTLLNYNSN